MGIRFPACAYEFLTMVTKGVVQGVYKVVIRLDILPLCYKVAYESRTVVEGQGRFAKCL